MSRIYLWDNLKVILMMQVVMTHSVNVYQIQGDYWIQYLWCFIMTYSMPLFMIISGFWYKERSVSYSIKHYLFPCALFSVINYVGGAFSGAYPDGIPLKVGWAMWYLWSLFIYSIITPRLICKLGINRMIVLSLFVVFLLGFKFVSNNLLDAQRVVNFYPFYLMGIKFKDYKDFLYNNTIRKNKLWISIFAFSMIIYIVLCYLKHGFCYGTGFMSSHGFSVVGFLSRWLNYGLSTIMAICLIMIVPNKEIMITKYGTRTMNVYLLHMSIIFPICWWLMRPIMHEWYGYCMYIVVVPTICLLLFSKTVDKIMKPILSLPDYKACKNNKL